MGQVEELPDDFDESLKLDDKHFKEDPPREFHANVDVPPPPAGGAAEDEAPFPINEERLKELEKDPLAPKMSATMASVKSNTMEDIQNYMNKTPLFMTDIDNAGDERKWLETSCFLYYPSTAFVMILFRVPLRLCTTPTLSCSVKLFASGTGRN